MVRKQRTTLNISIIAKSELDSIRTPGQSYDGIIREMVKFWKEKRKDYWTRRKEKR